MFLKKNKFQKINVQIGTNGSLYVSNENYDLQKFEILQVWAHNTAYLYLLRDWNPCHDQS